MPQAIHWSVVVGAGKLRFEFPEKFPGGQVRENGVGVTSAIISPVGISASEHDE
jgi:hypothetical protein